MDTAQVRRLDYLFSTLHISIRFLKLCNSLERSGFIPINHEWTGHKCEVYLDDIWLCSSISSGQSDYGRYCVSFNGTSESWETQDLLQVSHQQGGLISVRDRLFMIGGRTLSIEESVEGKWENASRNMTAILNSFEVLSFDSNPYLFGGYAFLEQEYSNRVWKFDLDQDTLSVVGHLYQGRMNFRSIRVDNISYHIGGFGELNIEKFNFENNETTMLNSKTENILYPELVLNAYYTC